MTEMQAVERRLHNAIMRLQNAQRLVEERLDTGFEGQPAVHAVLDEVGAAALELRALTDVELPEAIMASPGVRGVSI